VRGDFCPQRLGGRPTAHKGGVLARGSLDRKVELRGGTEDGQFTPIGPPPRSNQE